MPSYTTRSIEDLEERGLPTRILICGGDVGEQAYILARYPGYGLERPLHPFRWMGFLDYEDALDALLWFYGDVLL